MSETQIQIIQAEQRIEELNKITELGDRIMRLQNNADFVKVINEEFLLNEAARFVQLSEDPSLKPDQQQDALRIAQATGHLKRWISIQIRMANTADNEIVQLNELLDQLRAEG